MVLIIINELCLFPHLAFNMYVEYNKDKEWVRFFGEQDRQTEAV